MSAVTLTGTERGCGSAELRRDEFTARGSGAVQVAEGDRLSRYLRLQQHRRQRRQSTR